MTEKKRFKLHIKWFNPAKTNGEATLTDNGQPILCTETIEDAKLLKNLLNELYDENEQLNSSNMEYEDALGRLEEENLQLTHFIQELTTKNTDKIHLANGEIYKVNKILNDFKR